MADTNTDCEPETAVPGSIDLGIAGESARREYERRAERERARQRARIDADREWRDRIKSERPVLGRLAAALTEKPTMTPESQPTKAWATGAAGEQRVAQVLEPTGALVLHDRRIPGSKANIDHIAVGPTGVYVIDAKKYHGRVEKRDAGGLFRVDERLYVGGRDRTKLLDGMRRQLDVVASALDDLADTTPTSGIICFVEAEWTLFAKPIPFGTVTCIWPNRLAKLVAAPGPLGEQQVQAIAARLAVALPPA